MFKTTIRGLMAHKLRLLTSALAITIGVAFISGTLVLTNTITRTFDDLFSNVYAGTETVVRSTTVVKTDFGQTRGDVDQSLLDSVRPADGVADAAGLVRGYAQFVDHDGKAIGNPRRGAPTLAVNHTGVSALDPFQVSEGSPPSGPDQVVIDTRTSKDHHYAVGDQIEVLTATGPHTMDIVGLSRFGTADSPLGATVAMFDTATAQQLTDSVGRYTAIGVTGRPGVGQQQLADAVGRVLPPGTEAITGTEAVKEQQDQIHQNLSFFGTFMLVFAVIAVFVGSFVIYNTFSIIVAQRTREMALLRAIGASHGQVLRSVLAEAGIVGALFSAVGLLAGIGLAGGLKALLGVVGFGIPATGTVVPASAVVVAFATGLGVTLAVAYAPARRAARVPPIAALRDTAVDHSGSSKVRLALGGLLLAAGVGLLFLGLFGDTGNALASVGGGAALTFLGVAALGPVIATPVTRVIGAPLARFRGVTGHLARENAMRNPKRTSSTAAALMIGVGLVAFFTIFFASVTASVNHTIDAQFTGDLVVDSGQRGDAGLPAQVADQARHVPGVDAVLALQLGPAEVDGSGTRLAGVETGAIDRLANLDLRHGSWDAIGADGIAVSEQYAKDHGLGLGSTVDAVFAETGPASLTVAAIYGNNELVGDFFISREGFVAHTGRTVDQSLFIAVQPGRIDSVRAALDDITRPYPTAEVQDLAELKASQAAQIDRVLSLVYVLLFLAVVIALLGIANTLALSIFERTRELGLMRAVGMARRQVRTMVRWESVIIAMLGTALGLVIGLFFGWAVVEALSSDGITTLAVPVGSLAVVVVIAAVAGVVAAVLPARRASRLDILPAISAE